MKKIKCIIKVLLFLAIFICLFSYLSNLMVRKTIGGEWNHTEKISGFYNEDENEFDLLFFGSSNTYCSFNPLVIYDETKIKSYVFASQQQPVWASYTYIKEALKTQTPQALIMDILMFSKEEEYYDDGVNYSFMDDIPLSLNKIELAFASAPKGERFPLLVNFIKYHTRWNELDEKDYGFERDKVSDYLKGYVMLKDTCSDAVYTDVSKVTEKTPLSEKEAKYLDKIIKLSKKENIPLILVKTPSNPTEDLQKKYNEVARIAKENDVLFYDFNLLYDEIGLKIDEDFYDKTHLNYKGAEKFSKYFAKFLKEEIGILPKDENSNIDWEGDVEQYHNSF